MASPHELSIAFQTDKTAREYIALAQLVDTYDFDVVSVYCDAPFHPSYGPLMLMAPHIHRARIGPAAVSPSRIHPIDIAAQTALLAELAPGRVYAGFARGAWLADHGVHEIKPPIQAVRESVELVQHLLGGQGGGYHGQVYHLAEHVRAPYPLPREAPSVLIGTWGRRLAATAGEIADEVKIGGSANPDIVPVMREYIAVGERTAGRPEGSVGVVMGAVCVVDEDRERARRAARQAAALYLPVIAGLDPTLDIEPERLQRIQQHVQQGEAGTAAHLISDELLDRFAFSGSAHDLIAQCERLFASGASRVEFGTPHGIQPENGIHILGEQVLPALRGQR